MNEHEAIKRKPLYTPKVMSLPGVCGLGLSPISEAEDEKRFHFVVLLESTQSEELENRLKQIFGADPFTTIVTGEFHLLGV